MKIARFLGLSIAALSLIAINATNVYALDENAEPIDLKRSEGSPTLTKSEVVSHVKTKNKGRILSIIKNTKGGEDCHIVKMLLTTGEFKTFHVSCDLFNKTR